MGPAVTVEDELWAMLGVEVQRNILRRDKYKEYLQIAIISEVVTPVRTELLGTHSTINQMYHLAPETLVLNLIKKMKSLVPIVGHQEETVESLSFSPMPLAVALSISSARLLPAWPATTTSETTTLGQRVKTENTRRKSNKISSQ